MQNPNDSPEKTSPSDDSMGSVSGNTAGCPRPVLILAHKIAEIHGKVRVSLEKIGWHLNFTIPEGLKRDGLRELAKCHGSLNAELVLGRLGVG